MTVIKATNLPFAISKEEITQFCQKNGIAKLSLFGSVLRQDFRPDSDVDILVSFLSDRKVSFLDLARMERELSVLFSGRKIDLRTPKELSPYIRDLVINEAVVQYGN
ncbi:nucleotidyltransferase family protein [Pseudanabaena sp. BC1403]|uniref:nucleotidyltransferase family protein n=1 Tax=Pseudanabaena sp. BC1403 TaxID=2043171 RepID=UPI000CD9665A|nr:nucleotidyltransferase family protein [Pseudanabaena sp. BC1403]